MGDIMKKSLKVGYIGAGANTEKHHIPKIQVQEGVEAFGVANRSIESSKRVAEKFGIKKVYSNWKELLKDTEIDAVCIGTWPYMHAPLTIEALNSGKHVLVEARMAMNSEEAFEMENISKKNPQLITQVVPAPHTLPYDLTIIDWINQEMGDLLFLDMRITTGEFPNLKSEMHWRNNRDLSGNNIMHMGIWYEAAMRWLGTASSVNASAQTVVKRMKTGKIFREVTIPDHLEVMGSMSVGGKYHFTHSNVLGGGPIADVWIYGTKGTLHLYDNQTSSEVSSDNSFSMALEITKPDSNIKWEKLNIKSENIGSWRVEEEFVNAIRGKEHISHTSFKDGVKYMEFTDAVRKSWESASEIKLPLR